jgi:hypothetical protein
MKLKILAQDLDEKFNKLDNKFSKLDEKFSKDRNFEKNLEMKY